MSQDFTRTIDRDDGSVAGPVDQEIPRLIVAFSCHSPLVPGMRVSLASAAAVRVGRGDARRVKRAGGQVEISIGDDSLSRQHLVVRRVVGGWEVEDLGSKNGTLVNGERQRRSVLVDGDLIEIGSTFLLFRLAGAPGVRLHDPIDRDLAGEDAAGLPLSFRTLVLELEGRLASLLEISRSGLPVLVRGATGTGKELIARAVHEISGRRGAFVAINCGALPRTLIESELFGYRRGAFSGAREDREGLVRRAHGGSLFLDEVAELPAESQVALLRVLQEGEVRPIGAADTVSVDVRVVAATHQDVVRRIADGSFRQDLYARLAGFELALPPLRERREDIGTLVAAVLRGIGPDAAGVTFHRRAARALLGYDYPQNVRELELALRAAVVLSGGRQIRVEHLPDAIRNWRPAEPQELRVADRLLRERLVEVLRVTHGNIAEAARTMNKAPIQIRRWCRRFAIDPARFRE